MSKKEEIKIVVVEHSKIYESFIENKIDELYGIVLFPYKEIKILQDVYVIYSDEATEKRDKIFKYNTTVNGLDIYGTFIIIGKNKNGFVSLTDEQIEEVKDIFERKK